MISIIQGSTPTLIFTVENSDGSLFDFSTASAVELTITQPGRCLPVVRTLAGLIDQAEATLSYTMTEEQTFALDPRKAGLAQIRVMTTDGTLIPSEIEKFNVAELLTKVRMTNV